MKLAAVDIGEWFKLPQPGGGSTSVADSIFNQIGDVVSIILSNVFVAVGLIALFVVFGAGLALIFSSEDPEKKKQGGKVITAAVTGLVVIFCAYWIIKLVENLTGTAILNPPAPPAHRQSYPPRPTPRGPR